jgi:hypothetical protein
LWLVASRTALREDSMRIQLEGSPSTSDLGADQQAHAAA